MGGNDVEPGEPPLGAASQELDHCLVLLHLAHAQARRSQPDDPLLLTLSGESLLETSLGGDLRHAPAACWPGKPAPPAEFHPATRSSPPEEGASFTGRRAPGSTWTRRQQKDFMLASACSISRKPSGDTMCCSPDYQVCSLSK